MKLNPHYLLLFINFMNITKKSSIKKQLVDVHFSNFESFFDFLRVEIVEMHFLLTIKTLSNEFQTL